MVGDDRAGRLLGVPLEGLASSTPMRAGPMMLAAWVILVRPSPPVVTLTIWSSPPASCSLIEVHDHVSSAPTRTVR